MLQESKGTFKDTNHRLELKISGIVQGVGFRPYAFRLAKQHNLSGRIKNRGDHVNLVLEGNREDLNYFKEDLISLAPKESNITNIEENWKQSVGLKDLHIIQSDYLKVDNIAIPSDIVTCSECMDEFSNPKHRMYQYPFVACTNCGPRYSVVENIPYDRCRTTMRKFPLCHTCEDEFNDPESRRFHAQNFACPKCGPQLSFLTGKGEKLSLCLNEILQKLSAGAIFAIKGIGGYQLVCNAQDSLAIERLRQRKKRPHQAMAVMARSEKILTEDSETIAQLKNSSGPIVIVDNHYDLPMDKIAPDTNTLGLLLPTSPLHHILFGFSSDKILNFLIVTSGNIHGEPMITDDLEALDQLGGVADYFLIHDRDIYRRVDDSIYGHSPIRLARGITPKSFSYESKIDLLCMGADLKNTFSLLKNNKIHLCEHIGNLSQARTYEYYMSTIKKYSEFYSFTADKIVVDCHPHYFSSQLGRELAKEQGIAIEEVQHHLAHGVSLLFERNLKQAIVLTFDGTGYGLDNTLWGGECLAINLETKQWSRVASLELSTLLGNEKAIIEPQRQSYARLREAKIETSSKWDQLYNNQHLFSKTSSMGRLFDAVSALLIPRYSCITYEGQAAIGLETLAKKAVQGRDYPVEWDGIRVSTSKLFLHINQDLQQGVPVAEIALGFHQSVAKISLMMAQRAQAQTGITKVGLTGGVFQNKLLFELVDRRLYESGLDVFFHKDVPCNDANISLGQAIWAGIDGGTSNA